MWLLRCGKRCRLVFQRLVWALSCHACFMFMHFGVNHLFYNLNSILYDTRWEASLHLDMLWILSSSLSVPFAKWVSEKCSLLESVFVKPKEEDNEGKTEMGFVDPLLTWLNTKHCDDFDLLANGLLFICPTGYHSKPYFTSIQWKIVNLWQKRTSCYLPGK